MQQVIGVGPQAKSVKVSSAGDASTGSMVLDIQDRLVYAMMQSPTNKSKKAVSTPTVGKRAEPAEVQLLFSHI